MDISYKGSIEPKNPNIKKKYEPTLNKVKNKNKLMVTEVKIVF